MCGGSRPAPGPRTPQARPAGSGSPPHARLSGAGSLARAAPGSGKEAARSSQAGGASCRQRAPAQGPIGSRRRLGSRLRGPRDAQGPGDREGGSWARAPRRDSRLGPEGRTGAPCPTPRLSSRHGRTSPGPRRAARKQAGPREQAGPRPGAAKAGSWPYDCPTPPRSGAGLAGQARARRRKQARKQAARSSQGAARLLGPPRRAAIKARGPQRGPTPRLSRGARRRLAGQAPPPGPGHNARRAAI